MRTATPDQIKQDLDEILDAAQREKVLVTRNGHPSAVLVGLENKDAEDFHYMTSPEFWRMIAERRKEPTVRLDDVKEELLRDD